METLKLYWLGAPLVELNGRALKLETRKATALLAYLSLNLREWQRELLGKIFWPKANLQKVLADLHRTPSPLSEPAQFIQEFSVCNLVTRWTDHQERKS